MPADAFKPKLDFLMRIMTNEPKQILLYLLYYFWMFPFYLDSSFFRRSHRISIITWHQMPMLRHWLYHLMKLMTVLMNQGRFCFVYFINFASVCVFFYFLNPLITRHRMGYNQKGLSLLTMALSFNETHYYLTKSDIALFIVLFFDNSIVFVCCFYFFYLFSSYRF